MLIPYHSQIFYHILVLFYIRELLPIKTAYAHAEILKLDQSHKHSGIVPHLKVGTNLPAKS